MAQDRRDPLSGTATLPTSPQAVTEPSSPVDKLGVIHKLIHRFGGRFYLPL